MTNDYMIDDEKTVRKSDLASKEAMSDPELVVPMMNHTAFPGADLKPENLVPATPVIRLNTRNAKGKLVRKEKTLDLAYNIRIPGCDTAMMVGIEAQTKNDRSMPIRTLEKTSGFYSRQRTDIIARHRKDKDLEDEDYVAGFNTEDQVQQGMILTVNFGEEGIAESIESLIPYHPLNPFLPVKKTSIVVNVKNIPDEELALYYPERARHFYGLIKYSRIGRFGEYIRKYREYFDSVDIEMYDLWSDILGLQWMKDIKPEIITEKGECRMCRGFEMYMNGVVSEAVDNAVGKAYDKSDEVIDAVSDEVVKAKAEARKTFVEVYKKFNKGFHETVADYAARYKLNAEDAEKEVRDYWPLS